MYASVCLGESCFPNLTVRISSLGIAEAAGLAESVIAIIDLSAKSRNTVPSNCGHGHRDNG